MPLLHLKGYISKGKIFLIYTPLHMVMVVTEILPIWYKPCSIGFLKTYLMGRKILANQDACEYLHLTKV